MDELNAILQKYMAVFSDSVVEPMLRELDSLERKCVDEFRERIQTEDAELVTLWFANALKRLTVTKLKIEARHRSIEHAVMKGM